MRLKAWQVAALVLVAGLALGATPMTVYNATLLLLGNSCGWAWQTVRAVPLPLPPLKAAILNVTTDFDQLAHLISEFMEQPGTDPEVEQQFMRFLATRATRSYPRLESALDWLLSIYKFVFPFLIISMVAKLSGGGQDGGPAAVDALGPEEGAAANNHQQLGLARLASQPSGGWGAASAARSGAGTGQAAAPLAPEQQRQLAISRAISRGAKGPGADGGVPYRTDSVSPRGPETPVEGSRALPAHPAAGAAPVRQRDGRCEIREGAL